MSKTAVTPSARSSSPSRGKKRAHSLATWQAHALAAAMKGGFHGHSSSILVQCFHAPVAIQTTKTTSVRWKHEHLDTDSNRLAFSSTHLRLEYWQRNLPVATILPTKTKAATRGGHQLLHILPLLYVCHSSMYTSQQFY